MPTPSVITINPVFSSTWKITDYLDITTSIYPLCPLRNYGRFFRLIGRGIDLQVIGKQTEFEDRSTDGLTLSASNAKTAHFLALIGREIRVWTSSILAAICNRFLGHRPTSPNIALLFVVAYSHDLLF